MATADSASKGGAIHWKKLTVQGMQGAMDAGGLKSSSSLTDREAQHKPQENYAAKQPVVESGGHKLPQKTQQDEDEDKSGDAQRRETVIESVEPETTTTLVLSSAQVKIAAEKPNSDLERRQRRAERFGVSVQMSEEEKRRIRAQRFGGSSTDASEAKSFGTGDLTKVEEEKKRKARAERFGLPVSSVTDNEEAKKKARLVRFGLDMEEEKREARAARFGLLSKNSTPDVNKKS